MRSRPETWRCAILVVTRNQGDKISTSNGVAIVVVKVYRGKVQLGIDAPADVAIYRDEMSEGAKKHIAQRAARRAGGERAGDEDPAA